MNHSTLEGVIHFYDHTLATAWTVLKSLSNEPFSDTIGLKAFTGSERFTSPSLQDGI